MFVEETSDEVESFVVVDLETAFSADDELFAALLFCDACWQPLKTNNKAVIASIFFKSLLLLYKYCVYNSPVKN